MNTFCCRNSNGSCALGLDSRLEYNVAHWDCAIKHDSYNKKFKYDTCSWCDFEKCDEGSNQHFK